ADGPARLTLGPAKDLASSVPSANAPELQTFTAESDAPLRAMISAEVQCGRSRPAIRSAGQNSPAENATARLAGSCQLCPARASEMRCAAMSAAAAAPYRHNTRSHTARFTVLMVATIIK